MARRRETESVNIDALRRAIEGRDVERMVAFYADDAEMRVVDPNHPPRAPLELRGKEEIRNYLDDIFGRDLVHHVEEEVVGPDRISFQEACTYPDGSRVVGSQVVNLRDGKIARHLSVQVWDE